MKLSRILLKLGLVGLAWLAGCGWDETGGSQPVYGPMPVPLPHEPDVTITDFSYTPASPIRVGDTITFTAKLSRHTDAGHIGATVKRLIVAATYCNDIGYEADAVAGDGVYTGKITWEASMGTGSGLPVYATLRWDDGAPGQTLKRPAADDPAGGGGRAMKLLRLAMRLCGMVSMALAGAAGCTGVPAYGVVYPMYGPAVPPHDPSVVLQDFTYTPASPIHVGDQLTLQAHLNKPTEAASLRAIVKKETLATCYLNDAGMPPDLTEGDGVYTGALVWTRELGTGKGLPVWVELSWMDGAPGQTLDGPPLTILPEEGGQ